MVSVAGDTVNVDGATIPPDSPLAAIKVEVSRVRPLASVTTKETVTQSLIVAVNFPPLVVTVLGETGAMSGRGDRTL